METQDHAPMDADSARLSLAKLRRAAAGGAPTQRHMARHIEKPSGTRNVIQFVLRVRQSGRIDAVEQRNGGEPQQPDATCSCELFQLHRICVHVLALSVLAQNCLPPVESVVARCSMVEPRGLRVYVRIAQNRIERLQSTSRRRPKTALQ